MENKVLYRKIQGDIKREKTMSYLACLEML